MVWTQQHTESVVSVVQGGVMYHERNYTCLHTTIADKPMATQPTWGWCPSNRQHPDMDVHAQGQLLADSP